MEKATRSLFKRHESTDDPPSKRLKPFLLYKMFDYFKAQTILAKYSAYENAEQHFSLKIFALTCNLRPLSKLQK